MMSYWGKQTFLKKISSYFVYLKKIPKTNNLLVIESARVCGVITALLGYGDFPGNRCAALVGPSE